MSTNCAPLVTVLFCFERDFIMSLPDDTQADIIEVLNSKYLDDLLDIEKSYFEGMVPQIILLNCD